MFLRVLESENSTFDHKKQVLEVVTFFCDTPQALVEIFLTYDCDLHAIDLYNRIVNALSKVWRLVLALVVFVVVAVAAAVLRGLLGVFLSGDISVERTSC